MRQTQGRQPRDTGLYRGSSMHIKAIAIVVVSGLLLGGCANSGPKESGGAVVGGVAGGLIGNTIGHGKGRAAATI
jgi:outer membrane lipoprotein SlyB